MKDKELLKQAARQVEAQGPEVDRLPILSMDKILQDARSVFKDSEKGLGQQIVSGSKMPKPTKDCEFVCWKKSPWEVLTGIRGIPFGRVVQIAGKPDSGKTSCAMEFLKRAQQQGHIPILWDIEGKFSTNRFNDQFKGNSDQLFVVTSKLILEGADMVDALIESIDKHYHDRKILLVWDSVGGSLSVSEEAKDKRAGKQMAEAAKENGIVVRGFIQQMEALRNRQSNEDRLGVLLINQTYSNIGSHGQKEAGGQKVEFHSSIIVQLSRMADLEKVKNKVKYKVGIQSKAKMRKNHLLEGEDTVSELKLHVMSGGVYIDPKDPAVELLGGEIERSDDDGEVIETDDEE